MNRRRLLASLPASALALAALRPLPGRAEPNGQDFPRGDRTIRFVVPFPAGGTSDIRARQVAERLRLDAGWNVVVENRAGASGMIGTDLVARAASDGYSLVLGTVGTLAINPAVFPHQPYDVLRDLQPVTQFSRSVSVLLAHRRLGVASVAELDAMARSGRPLAYASTGIGSIGHMVGELYKRRAGQPDITHVPYKGTAPAVQDFIGFQVPLLFETPSAVWEQIRTGVAIPLAVTSAARMPLMPAVPTFAESGYPDLVFDTWQGVLTTRGVLSEALAALNRQIVAALRHPEVVRSHEEQVNLVVAGSPRSFERYIADETMRWAAVVKETGIKPL